MVGLLSVFYQRNDHGLRHPAASLWRGTVFKLAPVPNFTVGAGALSTSAVPPGQSATSTITVTSVNGLNSAVNLTCSVSPSPALAPTCAFSANPVTPTANGTATSTLTISTTAATVSLAPVAGQEGKLFYALWLPIPVMALLQASLGYNSKKRKWLDTLLGLVIAAGLATQLGCAGGNSVGGGGNQGTPAGNYLITVTATSGSTTNTTTLTLSIQ